MNNEKQIKKRIAKLQKKTYDVSDQISRKDLKNYIFSEKDEQRIAYYLGVIGKTRFPNDPSITLLKLKLKRYLHNIEIK